MDFPNGVSRQQYDHIVREAFVETCGICEKEIATGTYRERRNGKILCWDCLQKAKKAAAAVESPKAAAAPAQSKGRRLFGRNRA
jgi:hypothetical protein